MSAAAHADIEDFSGYRAGYTQKRGWKPRTYVVVCKTTAYDTAQKDLHESNGHFGQFLMQFDIIFTDFHGEMRLFRPSLHERCSPRGY